VSAGPKPRELSLAALRVVERDGWDGDWQEAVARESGVALAQVMARLPSREALAAAAMAWVLEQLPGEFADEVDADTPLHLRLYTIVAHELRAMAPYRNFLRGLLRDALNPFSATALAQVGNVARYLGFVTEQVRLARTRGEIFSWIPPWSAAAGFWVLHLRVLVTWLNDSSPKYEDSHAMLDRDLRGFVAMLGGSTRQEEANGDVIKP